MIAAEAGDLSTALERFGQAINLLPERASAYNNRAQARRLQGDVAGEGRVPGACAGRLGGHRPEMLWPWGLDMDVECGKSPSSGTYVPTHKRYVMGPADLLGILREREYSLFIYNI